VQELLGVSQSTTPSVPRKMKSRSSSW